MSLKNQSYQPIKNAFASVYSAVDGRQVYGYSILRTNSEGKVNLSLPKGEYDFIISSEGKNSDEDFFYLSQDFNFSSPSEQDKSVDLNLFKMELLNFPGSLPAMKVEIAKTFQLPYPTLGFYIFSENICHKVSSIQIAVDGENGEPIGSACTNDHLIDISRYFPKGPGATILHNYQLKSNIPSIKNVYVLTTFQVAPKSLPNLTDKLNTVELKIDKPIKMSVRYR